MKITFLAHSGFLIHTSTKTIGIDIWLDNPMNPLTVNQIQKLDYSCCTHDHFDHGFQTMIDLARRDEALFISGYEMMNYAKQQGCKTEHANIGSLFVVDTDLSVALTPAFHSSDRGTPVGIITKIEEHTIYHMGDTAFMSEFTMIRDIYQPDIVMIPIGGRYTMGPREAAYALDILQPNIAIPMHYNTFPPIAQNPSDIAKTMKTNKTAIIVLNPGENYII